jgi:hypothetical protein
MSQTFFVKLKNSVTNAQKDLENHALSQGPVFSLHLLDEILQSSFLYVINIKLVVWYKMADK